MTCDDVELELVTSEELSPAAREHLASCEKCRAYQASSARLLADAALPAPTAEEKAALNGLAPRVLHQYQRADRRRSVVRRLAGLAMAACVGAVVASAALLPKLGAQPGLTEVPDLSIALYEPEVASSLDTDEDFDTFEVSWPSP